MVIWIASHRSDLNEPTAVVAGKRTKLCGDPDRRAASVRGGYSHGGNDPRGQAAWTASSAVRPVSAVLAGQVPPLAMDQMVGLVLAGGLPYGLTPHSRVVGRVFDSCRHQGRWRLGLVGGRPEV
jgi:hypothetical protein